MQNMFGSGGTHAGALDQMLSESFKKVAVVADNLPAIQAVSENIEGIANASVAVATIEAAKVEAQEAATAAATALGQANTNIAQGILDTAAATQVIVDAAILDLEGQVDEAAVAAGVAASNAVLGVAAAVEAAAGVFTYEVGAFVKKGAGVDAGRYFAAVSLPFDLQLSSMFAQVLTGSGSISVGIATDDDLVIGPFVVDSNETEVATSVLLPAGSNVFVQLGDMSGLVQEVVVRVEGLPA